MISSTLPRIAPYLSCVESIPEVPEAEEDAGVEEEEKDEGYEACDDEDVTIDKNDDDLTSGNNPCPGVIVDYVVLVHPEFSWLHIISEIIINKLRWSCTLLSYWMDKH